MTRSDVESALSGRPGPTPGSDTEAASALTADGRTRRWDSHRAARFGELTKAARKAVHHGGPDLSMDEIAAAIGTSKSIVYRYFRDRAGLQRAVAGAVLEDMGAALAQATRGASTPQEALHAMVSVYLEMVSASPAVYAFVVSGTERPDRAAGSGADGGEEAPMRLLAHDAAELLVPVLARVLSETGRAPELAGVWAAGVIGFVRGAADAWLMGVAQAPTARPHAGATAPDAANPASAPHTSTSPASNPSPQASLTALAGTITDWICQGTLNPPPAANSPGHSPEHSPELSAPPPD